MSLIIRGLILSIMTWLLVDSAEARSAEERRVLVAGSSAQIEIFSLDLTAGTLKKEGAGSMRPSGETGGGAGHSTRCGSVMAMGAHQVVLNPLMCLWVIIPHPTSQVICLQSARTVLL